jgi:hypothetical protein
MAAQYLGNGLLFGRRLDNDKLGALAAGGLGLFFDFRLESFAPLFPFSSDGFGVRGF